ncbi:hypothetical protein KBI23_19405 [bacterium]|nr:hypothetical protein [bacterium]
MKVRPRHTSVASRAYAESSSRDHSTSQQWPEKAAPLFFHKHTEGIYEQEAL